MSRSLPIRSTVPARLKIIRLLIGVHLDAFGSDPLGYVEGLFWRVRGLRVRARNRISALSGRSSHAYDLWKARDEPKLLAGLIRNAIADGPEILCAVDCRNGDRDLQTTLASICAAGANGRVVLLGESSKAPLGTPTVKRPAELSRFAKHGQVLICALNPGDQLARAALEIYAQAIASASADVIYADDDLLGPSGRIAPHFKPEWNSDLFSHHDFISGSAIVRAPVDLLAWLPDDGWFQSMVGSVLQNGDPPVRLPYVLHHRMCRPQAVIPGIPSDLGMLPTPLVTAIIPTRDQPQLLRTCVDGLKATDYPTLDLIVIDNDTTDAAALAYLRELENEGIRVLRMPGPFNYSALNNAAVAAAKGDYLCLLNNDVQMLEPDWLRLMVRQARRAEIGAVGARLLYEDRSIQHAGVCLGIGGGAGHAHRFEKKYEPGYFFRSRIPQKVSAVTAACMVVAKEKFRAVGGFDEKEFPVAFNDVDLCLKLNERGWQSFYEPRATLIHHESKSRGSDSSMLNRARFARELAGLKRKWQTDSRRDPFHHPQLSCFCEQFVISI